MSRRFILSRSIASSLATAETLTSVSAVAASAAQTETSSTSASSLLTLLTFSSLGLNGLCSDSSGARLDLGLGDSELALDIGDAVVVESVVVMSPAEDHIEVTLGVETAHEHPDLQVVDLGVGVGAVELFLDSKHSVHEEGEEDFVTFGFFNVDHPSSLYNGCC